MAPRWKTRRAERFRPDTRLDWRDPLMPVIRPTLDEFGRVQHEMLPPHRERQEAELNLRRALRDKSTDWREDPSYWWRGRSTP